MGNYSFYKTEYIEMITVTDTKLKFKEHSHADDFVITMITDGYAEFILKSEKRHIMKGDIIIVSPYEAHSLVSEAPASIISVCVKKQAIYGFDKIYFAESMEKALSKMSFIDEISLFMNAVIWIYDNNHSIGSIGSDDCEKLRERIIKCPEERESLSRLADEVHFSKYHFIRYFRKVSGLTPRKFQIQSSIRKAQRLLREGKSSADTAAETGFYDQSHFNKYFKSIVGITPSEYVSSVSNFLQDKS